MDKVLQGKCQTFDLKPVLAQDTTCRARLGISLHPWASVGEGSSAGAWATRVRLTRPRSHTKPLSAVGTQPRKEGSSLSQPRSQRWQQLSASLLSAKDSQSVERDLCKPPASYPPPAAKAEPRCTSPARGGGRSRRSASLRGGSCGGCLTAGGGLTATRSCFNGQILTTPLGAF